MEIIAGLWYIKPSCHISKVKAERMKSPPKMTLMKAVAVVRVIQDRHEKAAQTILKMKAAGACHFVIGMPTRKPKMPRNRAMTGNRKSPKVTGYQCS